MKTNLNKDVIVISPSQKATVEKCDQSLYQRLDRNYNQFVDHKLVSCHEFEQDWTNWEIHPNGDEVIVLLGGKATFILDLPDGHECTDLEEEGSVIIIPQNIWHTVKTKVKTKLLFITPGEGTRHKSV